MNWGALAFIFSLSTIKFMVMPFAGPGLKLSFIETYMSSCAGAIASATVFYFMAEYFMKRSHAKRVKAREEAAASGIELKQRKKFTKLNRFIVRIKMRIGLIGICFWAPFFMSIPIGSIVTAKFYGKRHVTFPLMCIGVGINGLVTTSIAYILY